MEETVRAKRVDAVRRFTRFYTRQVGLLQEGLLRSPFSLTEARVLYELAHRTRTTARDVGDALGLDAGYLSRILRGFETRGLIAKRPDDDDRRQLLLTLTDAGRRAFAALDRESRREISTLLRALSEGEQDQLTAAMGSIERLLGDRAATVPYAVRAPQSGDMGGVVQSHGALSAREGIPHDHALDEQRSRGGATALRGGGVRAGPPGAAPQLRLCADRADVGAHPVTGADPAAPPSPPRHFLLFYEVVEDHVARRGPHREAHLAHARRARERGELLLAGALSDPVDGAVLLFQAREREVPESFARSDPYVLHGLVTAWQVREWTTVVRGDPRDIGSAPEAREGGRAGNG